MGLINPLKSDNFQVFGNDTNKSKLPARGNQEQIKFRECLLPFSLETFVFLSAIQKCNYIPNYIQWQLFQNVYFIVKLETLSYSVCVISKQSPSSTWSKTSFLV